MSRTPATVGPSTPDGIPTAPRRSPPRPLARPSSNPSPARAPERAPAACVAAGAMAAGLCAGYGTPAAGAAILAVGACALARRGARTAAWAGVGLLLGARLLVSTGAARGDVRAWERLAGEGGSAAVAGIVRVERVRETRPGRWTARGRWAGSGRPWDGASVLWWGSEGSRPAPGERWRVAARIVPERPRAAPGARYPPPGLAPGARRATLRDPRLLARVGERAPILATAERHVRERIAARFPPSVAGLATALLLGDRRGLDPALADAFAATGTVHLLAVSGLHVGFLAGLLAFGLSGLRSRPRARAWAIALPLAGYAALVGGRPSVVRAATMAALVLLARAGERRTSTWQAWGAAAVGILAWRPLDLFDLGFALSFGSVAGLLALAGPAARWIEGIGTEGPAGLLRLLAGGATATAAATAGTLAAQAAAFGWTAPVGLALNPVVVPLAALAVPAAWLALLADAFGLGPLAGALVADATLLLGTLEAAVVVVAGRVGPWVPGPAGWVAVGGSGLGAAALLARRRPAAGAAVASGALAVLVAARPPEPPGWRIVWLDVGQGDAIVITFPDGATWLVDAGPAGAWGDAGRSAVVPYLRRTGVSRVERLIVTHPDLDHVGGARSVVRAIDVRRLSSAGPVSDQPAWLGLLATGGPRGPPPVERLRAGDRLVQGGVAIDVLHPGPEWVPADPYASRMPVNEGSIVTLMSWRGCRLLLTGDLGAPGEARLVATLGDSLRAGLLHVGHHGSRHSSTASFLARVRPREAVASVGAGNRFGHPHPEALGRLAAVGARVRRTDRSGSVAAECGPDGWRVWPARP